MSKVLITKLQVKNSLYTGQKSIKTFSVQTTSENSTTHPQVKLPGGATLVAVTDRNADMLLKPKLLEKPHVTITMGDKQIQQPVCLLTNTVKFLFYFLGFWF